MANFKYKARLRSDWLLENADGIEMSMADVLRLLSAIESLGHLAGASKACNLSYRHAWGLLREAEKQFEASLLETSRRKGTKLTEFARRLLWANRRLEARLTPTLESFASELQEELARLYSSSIERLRLQASHGFAVEGLMRLANEKEALPLELRYRTAVEALASLQRGDCDVAGFQLPKGQHEACVLRAYTEYLSPEHHRLIYLSTRNTGLFVEAGNPKGIEGVADLVRPDVRFVNRQMGSSTRYLLSAILQQLQLDSGQILGFETTELTHMAVAAHIASGMADVGLGVETAAWRCGLDFIPLAQERYFFACHIERIESGALEPLLSLITSLAYRDYMDNLVGYDAQGIGQVLTLQQALATSWSSTLE
ncbi:substrate-binding domain-containing protein [Alcaligenes endophyticus]|uniref:Helix-turn-helix transcriptional regulator n=1 Tax=Alcaligenes endophyticus TaxID=1929088 RepID=A0ABT8EGU5_9BURK|nr:substrate-binding domain-containing protein [Alcaligenes endophyticus]MCX5589836.1 LysR family transcriptional regulator [Alcaligenes endophyticus]MDN4120501.1 helix-turn-helix transcriptional regulator [Alcaligenes endophyticus]